MLEHFHPAVSRWFRGRFERPTGPQLAGWASVAAGRDTLIAAPTGSGKTLAAFLAAIDDLVRQGLSGSLADETQVVYVSPLKALGHDIQRNLERPLAEIREELRATGLSDVEIRTQVRTGDTPASARVAMQRRPPHLLVTTPESLYILLTSESGRRMLGTVRSVIVDEIHALVDDRRGAHLALSLERLERLARRRLVRIGLSATQKPIGEVARFLVGSERPMPEIVDAGHVRERDLALELPRSPLSAVMSKEVFGEIYARLEELVLGHRTTLVFVNTRRLAERAAMHLGERLGKERVGTHHGSLSREQRLDVERRLGAGELRALVCTASLELGIDIGSVDLVCQLGSPRSIATLLQRVGRSGHTLGAIPKGRLFPLSRDELVECAALLELVRRAELDRVCIPRGALDVLSQQIVAASACEDWDAGELYALARRAYPYRELSRDDFDAVVHMLAQGFGTRRGRVGALVHHDEVNGRVRGRRGARMIAITNGGAIPDNADYRVLLEPTETFLGTLHEDFAAESMTGDVFQLGNASWRIVKIEPGRVRVEDAKGQPPGIPFWFGEAPGRTDELSRGVSELRERVSRLARAAGTQNGPVIDRIAGETGITREASLQLVEYLAAGEAALGAMPTQQRLVVERFFDESGGMQLVVHAPFGSRLNRAWGLALRKRFCRLFNFELQAAATEDAIVLSLGPTHSFPLADVFELLHPESVRDVLVQALLLAPVFATRWRWNASRSLAVPRMRGGRKVPGPLQRMIADDLLALVFPDQQACAENLAGQREVPDHPLVGQTIHDCLHEAMDLDGLVRLLEALERNEPEIVARDLSEPSPLAKETLDARPYAFLDDAPLEERRTQAVLSRRWLAPEEAASLGALDAAAIARVRAQAWPDPRDADELSDALAWLGCLRDDEGERAGWTGSFDALRALGRATLVSAAGARFWVAVERLPELVRLHPGARCDPPLVVPARIAARVWSSHDAQRELVRGRLSAEGPVTAAALAATLAVPEGDVDIALAALEAEGVALRGRFSPGTADTEWCDRRLLARIHRATLDRLRREIEPVSASDFVRFLSSWQHAGAKGRLRGVEGLAALLEQLDGFEAPAGAWESDILPARLVEYDPAWLDARCLSGRVLWARISVARDGHAGPVRATPIAIASRAGFAALSAGAAVPQEDELAPSANARAVMEHLRARGACFFADIADGAKLPRTHVEEALGELVAKGLVTADAFIGLRALLTPSNRRPALGAMARGGLASAFSIEDAGRWTLLPPRRPEQERNAADVEVVARVLLRRWGVVFRRVVDREGAMPPWRELLRVYRTLEMRGEVRGGHFVSGFSGEQYALPDAVGLLRATRREPRRGELVSVSGADPLNVLGVLTPGARLPIVASNRLLLRDGEPIAVREGGKVRFLVELEPAQRWEAQSTLIRKGTPPQLRAYLGSSA